MNKVELLAPAKDYECAIAAINSGADAIYIGASDFGARVNASNSLETIKNIVDYAHKFYVRVHVTINTILNNEELKSAIKLVKILYDIGVDAIIVQDMGLIKGAIDEKIPPIQIHASTQCDNSSFDKVMFFDKIGLSRVILARESSLSFIESICKNVNCEIETFIHGALCVSYSGQCYLSYVNGGRSANKGCCAQPCRKRYSLVDQNGAYLIKNKYLLSLKDLNMSKSIEKLINAGVKSFKIEGRLKDVNYVKNITNFYNRIINNFAQRTSSGKVYTSFDPDTNKTFNRGYTEYFLYGRGDCYNFESPKFMGEEIGVVKEIFSDYFTADGDIKCQDGLCFIDNGEINGFLVNKVENNKVYPNKKLKMKKGTVLYKNYDYFFNESINNAKFKRQISVYITIENGIVYIADEDSNSVFIDLPNGELPIDFEKQIETYKKQFSKGGDSYFHVEDIQIKDDKIVFLPLSKLNEMRRLLFEKLMDERIKNYPKISQKPISYADYFQNSVDYKANVFNDEAEKFYNCCNCKVEERAIESLENVPSGIEIMRTKHCIRYALNLCSKQVKDCRKLFLEDETGKRYPLKFDCAKCEMVILNP